MSIEKSKNKIKYPFTAIPNFILSAYFKNELSEAEFKLIALFLSNKPGFKYSKNYFRNYFSPKTTLKYIPILIENKFLLREEIPIDRFRFRVKYSVRPINDWIYNPDNQKNNNDKDDQNLNSPVESTSSNDDFWSGYFDSETSKRGVPKGTSYRNDPLILDHNDRRSTQKTVGSERLGVPKGTKEGYPREPYNKTALTRLPKDVTKGGRDFREPLVDNSFPSKVTDKPFPPYKGNGISKTYLTGKVQQIYRFIARNAALTLITDLLQQFPPETINAAINVALTNSESKFFREYRPSHFQNWVTECENQRETHEIDKLNAGNNMSAIIPLPGKNNATRIAKTIEVNK